MATTFMHPGVGLRSRVFLKRGSLSRRLAEGASPSAGPELGRRAQQLTSGRSRRALAHSIENVIEAAEERPRPHSSIVPLRRGEIIAAQARMRSLAVDLRDTEHPANARGVALVEQLLCRGDSPLYNPSAEETVDQAVRHARSALFLA